MKKAFIEALQRINIEINDVQYKQFEKYYELLVEWNSKINLTAITDEREVFFKHFLDSIYLVQTLDFDSQTLLDVGSGAGFPSIPLKIIYPNLKVTIIDALKKRITFLELLTKELDVEVTLIHGRAEEFMRKHCYDIVTARAVANLNMLSELCIPFVKIGGLFLAMKGPKLAEEIIESKRAIEVLGGTIIKDIEYTIDDQARHILVVEKTTKSDKIYPRKFAKIKSSPL